jgi:hypothetical integral membrane protein (TIGR02206 family)
MAAPFQTWSPDHFAALALAVVLVGLAAVAPRGWSLARRAHFRSGFGWACIGGLMLGIYVELTNPEKALAEAIPFHLCSVSLVLTAVALWRLSPLATEWAYVYGVAGVMQAILTPDLPTGFPSLKYFVFFFNHGAILVGVSYLLGVENIRPRPGALLRLWFWGCCYMGMAGLINVATGTNFGYLARKPERPSLLDILGPWPWYIGAMQVLGVVKILVLLLPFRNRWSLILGAPQLVEDFPRPNEESATESVPALPDQTQPEKY